MKCIISISTFRFEQRVKNIVKKWLVLLQIVLNGTEFYLARPHLKT